MTSLKSEQPGLAPMGVLLDGAELPEVGTGQDFPPVWSPYRLQAELELPFSQVQEQGIGSWPLSGPHVPSSIG